MQLLHKEMNVAAAKERNAAATKEINAAASQRKDKFFSCQKYILLQHNRGQECSYHKRKGM
jgi:hypothetical protein